MIIRSFQDLTVWQRSMELLVDVYRVTSAYPRDERFTLTSATRKTAISLPSNIAEGAARRLTAPYLNHVNIAIGSEGELFTQLDAARRLGFVSATVIDGPLSKLNEIGRMLTSLAAALERKLEEEEQRKPRR